ncbi:Uncharacterised protein [Bordetella pertussis]|nr:Uncharacterised protein [Bordetella pertussis]
MPRAISCVSSAPRASICSRLMTVTEAGVSRRVRPRRLPVLSTASRFSGPLASGAPCTTTGASWTGSDCSCARAGAASASPTRPRVA